MGNLVHLQASKCFLRCTKDKVKILELVGERQRVPRKNSNYCSNVVDYVYEPDLYSNLRQASSSKPGSQQITIRYYCIVPTAAL